MPHVDFFRAKERAENMQRMSAAKPGANSKKRHKVLLHPSQPPSKKARSTSSGKHTTVDNAFEHPSGQSKKIEFKFTEAITNIFDSGEYEPVTGKSSFEMLATVDQTKSFIFAVVLQRIAIFFGGGVGIFFSGGELVHVALGNAFLFASHVSVSMISASHISEPEGFGRFAPPPEAADDNEEEEGELISEENDEFISSAELRRNRISSKGWYAFIVFGENERSS